MFCPPKDQVPVVAYQQGNTDGYMCCSLESFLEFFCNGEKAQGIYNMQRDHNGRLTRKPSLEKIISIKSQNTYNCVIYSNVNAVKYPYIEEFAIFVVLQASDGSLNHSITI